MHHLKEITIDGVRFVLIPEELHDQLVKVVKFYKSQGELHSTSALWEKYDPEIFNGL